MSNHQNEITPLIHIVNHYQCELGEGPVWDAKRNSIIWLDIIKGNIHEYNITNSVFNTTSVHQMIGSFALCEDGHFVAALQQGLYFINKFTGEQKLIAQPEIHLPQNRFNDGKCDPAGRFWAGTMSTKDEEGVGNVYMLDKKEQLSIMIEQVTISNGLAWSLDHKTLYYIDTPTYAIVAYDYDLVSGQINNKRVVINFEKSEGYPDGMTIDTEGMLWIAHWGGWQVSRWDPNTGQKLSHFKLPVEKVTSCTFGGENYTDLYITSAKVGLTDQELQQQPLAGSLFVIPFCGFKGIAPIEFQGVGF